MTDRRRLNGRYKRGLSVDERFWSKVEKSPEGCWQWTASTVPGTGYATFYVSAQEPRVNTHRWAYERFVGIVPPGLHLDHLCRNRSCVNPEHLEPVTPQVNTLRGISFAAENAAKTACPQGHPYDEENTYRRAGRRYCLACRGRRNRRAA